MVLGGTPVKEKALCRTTGVACLAAFCSVACKSPILLPVSWCSAVSPVHIPLQRGACRQHGMQGCSGPDPVPLVTCMIPGGC